MGKRVCRKAQFTGIIISVLFAIVVACGFSCPTIAMASSEDLPDAAVVFEEDSVSCSTDVFGSDKAIDTTKGTSGEKGVGVEDANTNLDSSEPAELVVDAATGKTTDSAPDSIPDESDGMTGGNTGPLSVPSDPVQPVDSSVIAEEPALTGYVYISGNTKVGSPLVAGVEDAPENAVLIFQWYRGENAITGATTNVYTTTSSDDGCDISCRVTASGYEGVLVSGVIRPTLPILTGSVVISGNASVGSALKAVVNGVQANAQLKCQWYRGDVPVAGATGATYILTQDDTGAIITCKVSASNYRGTLVSNTISLRPQTVTLEYWSYTDASPDQMVIVHSKTVGLNDLFDYTFDQNKDDDPSNDYIGYECMGWCDEWYLEFYDIASPADGFTTTIKDIADLVEWDGVSPIRMDAYMNLRYIEVTYETGGYEDEYDFTTVTQIAWFDSPYCFIDWACHKLISQTDKKGNPLSDTMTCGYILTELLDDPWADSLTVYFTWEKIDYRVRLVYPKESLPNPENNEIIVHVEYGDKLELSGWGYDLRPGREFLGWFTEPNGNGREVTSDLIYAQIAQYDTVEEVVLYAYVFTYAYTVTIDLGAGKWIDGANETRPNAFPSFSGQNMGTFRIDADSTVNLPIDVRYGGLVEAPVDGDGRSYVLRGFAFESGSVVYVTYPDGTRKTMEDYEAIAGAKQLNGLMNYAFYKALMDAQVIFAADSPEASFITWPDDFTLYAIWTPIGVTPTFDPRGYADFNDPDQGTKYRPCYKIYFNPDGSIDETRTTATAAGSWNTPEGKIPAGYEGGAVQLDAIIALPAGNLLKRPGYIFAGWSTKLGATEPDADLTYQDLDRDGIPDAPTSWTMFSEPTTLYAVWKTGEVEVVFDVNAPDVDPIFPGGWFTDCEMVIPEEVPVREGYVFRGWAVIPEAVDTDYQPGDFYHVHPLVPVKMFDDEGNPYWKEVNPNILYAVWQPKPVILEYWSLTDDSPGDYVLVNSMEAQLTDRFYREYDQNKDNDPTNDYVAYNTTGWFDEYYYGFYESTGSDGDTVVTIRDVADYYEWDGTGPIIMYANLDIRMIDIIYDCGGYEENHEYPATVSASWSTIPFDPTMSWQGYTLRGIYDGVGHELSGDMTCGYILTELMKDPWGSTIEIKYVWDKIDYKISYVYPDGTQVTQHVEYTDALTAPFDSSSFDQRGYEFMGWFTEIEGKGQQVEDGTRYCALVRNDRIDTVVLYAYFRPIAVAA